jgi:predicted hydrocarbon binding protein
MATCDDRIKGSCVKSVLGFLGQEALLEPALAGMTAESRVAFAARVLPTSWYPAGAYIDLLDAAARRIGPGSERTMLEIGRRIVADGLTGVYKIFLPVDSPRVAAERGRILWRTYFKGSELALVRADAGVAVFEVRGEPRTSHAYCLTKLGGMIGALEIVGAAEVQGEHTRCRSRGDDACRFKLTWKE